MNSVKGATACMMAFWEKAGLTPPIKLMNHDKTAAATLDGPDACECAGTVSQGGAVKLTSLTGAVFSNKDKKKGQQDSLQVYLEETIEYMVCFLDTSNTCYQCHCDAAVELIIQLVFYQQFLELVWDLKDK
jgi:hypothetical protein